ncbi:MAG TPA: tetratricopeptide repeat protein [Gemmatimonadaceae bacterium]|nr:tetratricopeptide repeat protein [Gemmatimonadaceae bacterium]
MSLIADALKAAEKNKAQRMPPPTPRAQPEGYFPIRLPARGRGEPIVSPTVIAVGVAVAAIALVALVLAFSPSRRTGPRTADLPVAEPALGLDSAASTIVLDTPGDPSSVGLTNPDLGSPIPAQELDEYDVPADEPAPPRRRAASRSSAPVEEELASSGEPLPSIVSSRPGAAPSRPGRLEITVDRPIQSSPGSGLFEQGLAAQRRGDYVGAKNFYLQATYLAPRNPELFNNLGTVYRALRDMPAAEAAYRNATEVDGRFAPAWSNLGVVLGQQGRTREAITALQEAVRLDPSNAAAKVNLAIQLHSTGMLPGARTLLQEALTLDPGLAEAHYELGRLLERQGERTGAIIEYQQFLAAAGGRFPELELAVRSRLRRLSP